MKVSEAMALLDKYTGAEVEDSLKYMWLQRIEDTVYEEIISTHADPVYKPAQVSVADRQLLAPEPYSEFYIHYMNMQNDLLLRDYQSYANSASAFAAAYCAYCDWYNRTHMPNSPAGEITV